ncbi:TonB-dependent receptor [Sphingosinicella sp. YJ22]|uniref:TonB-dependent receptor n=1 Tax=Sphingosinicella sp. YJ22 TaxID=1104780 RepID=UPI00140E9537|nr:TonB-dependent receptor [Sphingosinicella sp. YJ22]
MSKTYWMLSVGALALATPAYAQDDQPTTESPVEAGAVDQQADEDVVIVTAQGRSQSLQDVPIAVNVVNGEALQNSGATDIRALNQLAPSLLVSSTGSEANGSARIRGIGTVGDNPGLESSVAVFIDGVYRSRSGIGLNELGEIERIEVLRGPQGTLFGRNASAGLIHIISRRPNMAELDGYAELTYGNYDHVRVAGAISGPLTETLGARLDAVYVRRDGFYTVVNPTGGTEPDVNDRNRLFTRAQLLFEPNDALSVRLIGDYTWREESCCGAVFIETRETFDPTPGVPGDFAFSPTENRIETVLRSLGARFSSENDPYGRLIDVSPGRTYLNETTDYGVSMQVDYDFGDINMTSITAYRGYKSGGAGDIDYNNVDILYRAADGNVFREFNTFTQELRFNGTAFDGALDWLVGGYFAQEDLTVVDNTRFGSQYGAFAACRLVATLNPAAVLRNPAAPGCLSPAGRATVTSPVAFGPFLGPAVLAGLDRLSTVNNVGDVRAEYLQNSQNFALFTHNIFNITDQISLTLGARYTFENKDFEGRFNNDNTACPAQQAALSPLLVNPAVPASARAFIGGIVTLTCVGNSSVALNGLNPTDSFDDGELSGTAVLSYQPNRDTLLYASYSRGYKAGGYNLDRSDLGSALSPRSNADAANLRFAAEINDAYEIGFKLTGRNFQFSAAAFHQRFRDFQLNTFNGTVFIVQNINGCSNLIGGEGADSDPSAVTGGCAIDDVTYGVTSTGLELELSLRPHPDLAVNLGYTFSDTRYRSNLIGSNVGEALDPFLFLLPGDNLSNAPEHVATASVSWTPPIGNSGMSGLFYLDGRLTDDFNTGSDLFPEKEQNGFLVVNGRVGLRGPDERWSLEVWAQNLFDEEYTQVAFNTPVQGSNSRAHITNFGATQGFGTANQLFSAFLAEPRTYGITGRFRF